VLVYKFLRPGAVGPFSGLAWPVGEWMEAPGALALCRSGIHACRVRDLPYWITEELWRIELEGEVVEEEKIVLGQRGRLVERVSGWTRDTALDFARACAERAGSLGDARGYADHALQLADAARDGSFDVVPTTAYVAAHAGPYTNERSWQARWLEERLGLQPARA
jgi:hypothetical protein